MEEFQMETNYRIAYDKWWQDLKRKVPEDIATQQKPFSNKSI